MHRDCERSSLASSNSKNRGFRDFQCRVLDTQGRVKAELILGLSKNIDHPLF